MDVKRNNNSWRRRWREDLKRIEPIAGRLVFSKYIYHGVAKILKNNPKVNKPSSFHVWIIQNYVESSAVAVRALLSGDKRSVSLFRMIQEMSQHADALTRRSFLHAWDKRIRDDGDVLFDEIAGEGAAYVPKRVFENDLDGLKKLRLEIKRLVDGRIAHLDRKNLPYKTPTFDHLNNAISQIDDHYCSYKLLLTGSRPDTLLPECEDEWMEVLRVPWIEDDEENNEVLPRRYR